ncbi:tRNA (guanosine(46)-N7)-methyltransferase TrmB [Amygdalobacter nucleatus]|uniref:tRNA (guanine-N(7)-)-methyltransferase n=1 Tax=Amygdalobacter nucleatus TaxID=3029274 RepID=A0A133Y7M1_9FIRM|nr:tRNA (guanosine(46)-N7)-methyltransferase TrmB [Amygdalobacter nucleatus]KXB39191.1 tRNA (guanine-N(7)-)-methyltransferase [Amygdalobacter nucleatus]MDF0485481.1 tRNA (guanosine(46)-N7)-methyltransferase TrmB [Amygdalobacter nucleatus]
MRVRKKKWAKDAIAKIEQCLTGEAACAYKGKWRSRFDSEQMAKLAKSELVPTDLNATPLYLEIGCGKGKFVSELALKNPKSQIVAMDSEINALCFAAKKVEAANLPVSLIFGTAENLKDLFSEQEVDRIYLNFSTPWPKTAHHKRRLTYPTFLADYQEILKTGGEIIVKTDNDEFFQASQAYLKYMGFQLKLVKGNLQIDEDVTGIMTEYEARFREQGLPIYQLVAIKLPLAEQLKEQAKWQAANSPLRANTDWQYDFDYYAKLCERKKHL